MLLSVLLLTSLLGTLSAEFTCPREGIFADPDNCQNFLLCFYHIEPGTGNLVLLPEVQTCPDTELFDEIISTCNYDYNVDCGSRPLPGGNTGHTTGAPPTTGLPSSTTTRTTTTAGPGQTTFAPPTGRYPDKIVGMYLAIADDTVPGFEGNADWQPLLYPYQQDGANVLFFSFINPKDMTVPPAFEKLARTRGTGIDGAIPSSTKIMFAIGGYLYSQDPNPWDFLTSQAKAEAMADEVATWPSRYGCDGVDLDIEEGAGFHPDAGPNLVHFIRRLRQLVPDIIVGQPTYGYPAVDAANVVINNSWRVGGGTNNLADTIGIMVYEGTQSLNYVDAFAHGSSQWEGYPITVDVPNPAIIVGSKGSSSGGDIGTLAAESMRQNLQGIMVWYASVRNGFQFDKSWDASGVPDSEAGYVAAMQLFNSAVKKY